MNDEVLLVEDDKSVQEATALLLERAGFLATVVDDGEKALEIFSARRFSAVILDLMLPTVDGLEVCRRIRATSNVPIIIVTARADTAEIVAGLECGADDYVTKPFSGPELLARIRAALRRAAPIEPGALVRVGALEIDSAGFRVRSDGRPVDLSTTEFRLLLELAGHRNQVLTRQALLRNVWGYDYLGDSRLVDMAITRLRGKIGDDSQRPRYIETVRGVGYRFIGA
jgi:two-component system response regulator MtrA